MDSFHYFEECIENLMHSTELPDSSPFAALQSEEKIILAVSRGKGMLLQGFLLGHLRMPDSEYLSLCTWHSQELHSKAGPWQEPLLWLNLSVSFCQTSTISFTRTERLIAQLYLQHPLGMWLLKLCLLWQNLLFLLLVLWTLHWGFLYCDRNVTLNSNVF